MLKKYLNTYNTDFIINGLGCTTHMVQCEIYTSEN